MTTASCAGATKQRDKMCFWSTAGTPNPPGQAPPDTRQGLRSHSSLNPTPLAIFLPRLAACPTPHGRTVNCAPAHRYLGSSVLEMSIWLQHPCETILHSLPCIAMQTRRNHQVRFSGLWPGKVLEMANSLQSDAEGLSEGAGKRCYGKYVYPKEKGLYLNELFP